MKFLNKSTNEIKEAYSITLNKSDRYDVQFVPNGKIYSYGKENVDIIDECSKAALGHKILIYSYSNCCYRCGKNYPVYTYILWEDTYENLSYPWDKHKLNRQSKSMGKVMAHMLDESIEFYPIEVLGSNESKIALDKTLVTLFPKAIKVGYSQTIKANYVMNYCPHCKAIKGENYLYRDVNTFIANMQKIDIVAEIDI